MFLCLINNILLTIEVDRGASFSVISKKTYYELFTSHHLDTSIINLKTYTGESLKMYGQFMVTVQYHDQKLDLLLIVAGDKGPSLLGRDWMYSLKLDWNTILHLRTFTYFYVLYVEAELDRLTSLKVIEPVQFSDWAAPIVPVLKSDNSYMWRL